MIGYYFNDVVVKELLVKQFAFKLVLVYGINNSENSDSWFVKENAFGKL